MCHVLSADKLLALFLARKQQVSFGELLQIRDLVERANPNIVLDVSGPSIDLALAYYPHLFERQPRYITRATEAGRLLNSSYLNDEFLSDVPREVSQQLEQTLASF